MTAETKIKALLAAVSLGVFLFSIYQFLALQSLEARKPYLERKLAWCEEAVETTAKIAAAQASVPADVTRFWELYWGVMGLIEREDITQAMIAFGETLTDGDAAQADSKSQVDFSGLTGRSLALAHACRRELAREWSTHWARGAP